MVVFLVVVVPFDDLRIVTQDEHVSAEWLHALDVSASGAGYGIG